MPKFRVEARYTVTFDRIFADVIEAENEAEALEYIENGYGNLPVTEGCENHGDLEIEALPIT